MDSGVLADNETFEDDFDVLREILPGELIGLMDQILCHEVRFLGTSFGIRVLESNISDADSRPARWHGIWVTRSHSPYSLRIILTGYCGPNPRIWKRPALVGKRP